MLRAKLDNLNEFHLQVVLDFYSQAMECTHLHTQIKCNKNVLLEKRTLS